MMWKMKLIVQFIAGCLLIVLNKAYEHKICRELVHEHSYVQHEAPDVNALWKIVNKEIRGKKTTAAKIDHMHIDYAGGVTEGVVGTHSVRATASFYDIEDRCYDIAITILDTDECVSTDPKWMHQCHSSAVCENYIGGYNCACPKNSGTFGKLFSGSTKLQSSPEYETSPGMCHGFQDTEICCGVSALHDHHRPDKHQLSCHTAHCIEHCKQDFVCDEPCNAITEAMSPRAKLIGEDIVKITGDMDPLYEYQRLRETSDARGWRTESGWKDRMKCSSDDRSASFQVSCFEGEEPLSGFRTSDTVPGFPKKYEWVDRANKVGTEEYITPTKEVVNLQCEKTTIPRFCDPRDKMQCPCNCGCVDADDYNRITGADVPLGTAYYCLPNEGHIKIEPADYKGSLTVSLEQYYDSTWPPRHINNKEDPGHRNDTHMCVDQTGPDIRVDRNYVDLHQCDESYEPDHPDIHDDNKHHEFNRRMGIQQSPELYGVDGYITQVGTYEVEYSVESPWLAANKLSTAKQTVRVHNTNECGYQGTVDYCQPKCYHGDHDSLVNTDAICTDVVMQDDNQGPGYLCSCPEGYTGNAFNSYESFKDNHAQMEELRRHYETSSSYSKTFESFLSDERGVRQGSYASNPMIDSQNAIYCKDAVPPVITSMHPVIELEAASCSGGSVMVDGKKLLGKKNSLDCTKKWDFVREVLYEHNALEMHCGKNFERCLTAVDYPLKNGKQIEVDYQYSILLETIDEMFDKDSNPSKCCPGCVGTEKHPTDDGVWFCGSLKYQAIFNVSDIAGNVAKSSVILSVKPVNLTKILTTHDETDYSSLSTREAWSQIQGHFAEDGLLLRQIPKWIRRSIMVLVLLVVLMMVYLNGYFLLNNTIACILALQLIVFPGSFINNRAGFDKACMVLIWFHQLGSFEHITSHQLDIMLEEKWQSIFCEEKYD